MFWKNVNLLKLSLLTKLMLAYCASIIGLLTAISMFLYPTFIKVTEQLNDNAASSITAECYEKIIITLLLSLFSAIILGFLIAKSGLSRIHAFENKIERITAHSLHERIDLDEWPKELKPLGVKFNMMLDRIQTSFAQLSQFSSDIAHELKNPINNLMLSTELALINNTSSDDEQKLLASHMQEYQQLAKLIENLLFIARSERGHVPLKLEVIDIQEVILKVWEYYKSANENNIQLLCHGNAHASVDIILFKRMISNLLSNAIKYAYQNSTINVMIEIRNAWIIITISDHGPGVADQHLHRLFDRFYRVDDARSSRSGGLGLGLSIVKSIVELHQGKITIKSQLNHGTTASIALPVLANS